MTDCLKRLLLIGWNGRMASWMTGLAIWSDNMCLVIIIFGFMVDDICCMLTSTKSKEEASWQAEAATDRQTDRRLNTLAQLKTTPENLATTTIIKNTSWAFFCLLQYSSTGSLFLQKKNIVSSTQSKITSLVSIAETLMFGKGHNVGKECCK